MERGFLKAGILLTILLIITISCGGGSGSDGETDGEESSVRILIQFPEEESGEASTRQASARQSVEDIRTITITIEDGFPTIERTFDITELPLEDTIFVPVGEDRIFTARARDANGLLIAIGSATVDVFPGDSNNVTIQLDFVEEVCDNGVDDNEDDLVDCEDPDCDGEMCDVNDPTFICVGGECVIPTPTPSPTPTPTLTPTPTPIEDCNDGIDNDGDRLVDCADSDCATDPACTETGAECSDSIDNDGDDLTDCADPDCEGTSACAEGGAGPCNDGMDNDIDDFVDCDDSDCVGQIGGPSGQICEITETICDDVFDNDANGLEDCADPNCSNDPACVIP